VRKNGVSSNTVPACVSKTDIESVKKSPRNQTVNKKQFVGYTAACDEKRLVEQVTWKPVL